MLARQPQANDCELIVSLIHTRDGGGSAAVEVRRK